MPADGAVVNIGGEYRMLGSVPSPHAVADVVAWALDAGDNIASSESLSRELPDLDVDSAVTSGALVINLPDGQYAIWFRGEVVRSVDWGGDPTTRRSQWAKVMTFVSARASRSTAGAKS